jgi:O-methyltransferase
MVMSRVSSQYIELLKSSLLGDLYIENELRLLHTFGGILNNSPLNYADYFHVKRVQPQLLEVLRHSKQIGGTVVLTHQDAAGQTMPAQELRNLTELSHTMIGRQRLDNLQYCVETVLADGIPGDFIETGIWRGGACIFMRGLLMALGATDRVIWCADSFEGVPAPTHPEDAGFDLSRNVLPILAVPLAEVQELFSRYGLLDEQVRFLQGWFKDSLAEAPIGQLAILRLDGDLYESTWDALAPLYDKVSPQGFIIVDDYNSCPPCRRAISDFRARFGITAELVEIDEQSVYWRKQ